MRFAIPYPLSRKYPRLTASDVLFVKQKQTEFSSVSDDIDQINILAFNALLASKGIG